LEGAVTTSRLNRLDDVDAVASLITQTETRGAPPSSLYNKH